MGKASIKESYIKIINGEIFVVGMHITPYEKGNIFNKDPLRTRKLLLHRKEINALAGATAADGYTIMPLKIYLKEGLIKMEIGLAKGKKLYDKREALKKKEISRTAERTFKVKL